VSRKKGDEQGGTGETRKREKRDGKGGRRYKGKGGKGKGGRVKGEGGEGHPLIRSNSKSLMNHQLRFSGEYVNIYFYLRKKYPVLKYL
jgi:hypothetical protein